MWTNVSVKLEFPGSQERSAHAIDVDRCRFVEGSDDADENWEKEYRSGALPAGMSSADNLDQGEHD